MRHAGFVAATAESMSCGEDRHEGRLAALRKRLLCLEGSSSGRDGSLRHFGGGRTRQRGCTQVLADRKSGHLQLAEAPLDAQGS